MCSCCVEVLFYVPAEPDEGTTHLGFHKLLNNTLPLCKIIQKHLCWNHFGGRKGSHTKHGKHKQCIKTETMNHRK